MKNYLVNIFDENNPDFVNLIDELPFWSAPFGLALLDAVRLKKNIRALDFACGTGFPLFELAGRLGETCSVYGLDSWLPAVEKIKRKISFYGLGNITAVAGTGENMPFESNFFDLVISNNGINNVADLDKTLSECFRVLKPGGQFAFTFNLPGTLAEFYSVFKSTLEELGLLAEIRKVDEHIFEKRKPPGYMEKLAVKNNFRVAGKTQSSFSYRFTDGTAFFSHTTFRFFFLPPWKNLLTEKRAEEVFGILEEKLNAISEKRGGLVMTIPFACFDCEKV